MSLSLLPRPLNCGVRPGPRCGPWRCRCGVNKGSPWTAQLVKSEALYAASGLAHLWQCQGKGKKVHNLLTPVYGWFMEMMKWYAA